MSPVYLVKDFLVFGSETPEERTKFEKERVAEVLGTLRKSKSIAKKRAQKMAQKIEVLTESIEWAQINHDPTYCQLAKQKIIFVGIELPMHITLRIKVLLFLGWLERV